MAGDLFADFFQFADVFAFLVLSAAGLAIIFGMMGVINMAHGEFIMSGVYVTAATYHAGLPLPLAQACGTVAAAILGVLMEVTIIRRLYSRPLDSLLVTFGISLIAHPGHARSCLARPSRASARRVTPSPSATTRSPVIAWCCSSRRFACWASSISSSCERGFGLYARATMQDADMAQALGVRKRMVYAVSFGIGAGLAGLCGALYAPTMSLIPTMGANFLVEAFVTVVIGGANVLLGITPAAVALAVVRSVTERLVRTDHR